MTTTTIVQFKFLLTETERRSLRQAALSLGVPAARLVRSAIAPYTQPPTVPVSPSRGASMREQP